MRGTIGLLLSLLLLLSPAAAIDKTGLFSVGARAAYWQPLGSFGEAYEPRLGVTVQAGYSLSGKLELFLRAAGRWAEFDETFWGSDFWTEDAAFTLLELSVGVRYGLEPLGSFIPYAQAAAGYNLWTTFSETALDRNGDGIADSYEYTPAVTADSQCFGLHLQAGGEFFATETFAIDLGAGWSMIFDAPILQPLMDDDGQFIHRFSETSETVNIIHLEVGLGIYL